MSVNLQNTLIRLNQKMLNQCISTNEMKEYICLLKLWQAILDVEKYKRKCNKGF